MIPLEIQYPPIPNSQAITELPYAKRLPILVIPTPGTYIKTIWPIDTLKSQCQNHTCFHTTPETTQAGYPIAIQITPYQGPPFFIFIASRINVLLPKELLQLQFKLN